MRHQHRATQSTPRTEKQKTTPTYQPRPDTPGDRHPQPHRYKTGDHTPHAPALTDSERITGATLTQSQGPYTPR